MKYGILSPREDQIRYVTKEKKLDGLQRYMITLQQRGFILSFREEQRELYRENLLRFKKGKIPFVSISGPYFTVEAWFYHQLTDDYSKHETGFLLRLIYPDYNKQPIEQILLPLTDVDILMQEVFGIEAN